MHIQVGKHGDQKKPAIWWGQSLYPQWIIRVGRLADRGYEHLNLLEMLFRNVQYIIVLLSDGGLVIATA